MRYFLGIEIIEPLRTHVNTIQVQLNKMMRVPVRWVKSDQIHLTIKFIENLDKSDVPIIYHELNKGLVQISTFNIYPLPLGVFPNKQNPRVIWMGVEFPTELTRVCKLVNAVFQNSGYLADRKGFSPHLTLARIKQPLSNDELINFHDSLKTIQVDRQISMGVKQIKLFSSVLKPTGPVYREVFCIQLGKA